MTLIQYGKMYEAIRGKKSQEEKETKGGTDEIDLTMEERRNEYEGDDPWEDEEDRVTNYYITTNPEYNDIPLPKIIKLTNPKDGEIQYMQKRTHPKIARIHKKREDNDPHRFFLSELMLYTGFTDEEQLGSNDEQKCMELYMRKKESIQFVKSLMMPFTEGVDEARHYVQEAMRNETDGDIGEQLDPEHEQEILECRDNEESIHPDFVQLNPDDFEIDNNLVQVKKTFRKMDVITADEILKEARNLDKFQKRGLHVAVKYAQDIIIARKGKQPYPRAPFLMVNGGAGSGKSTLIHVISQYVHRVLMRDGDDPDCPYVLLSAYTGGAASNIKGQTLHTLFSFNFGAGYMSLNDK